MNKQNLKHPSKKRTNFYISSQFPFYYRIVNILLLIPDAFLTNLFLANCLSPIFRLHFYLYRPPTNTCPMNHSRRTALKQLLTLAGGVMLIPACMQGDGAAASIKLKHLNINASKEKLLAELAEGLIPASKTPGGKDLYLHHFALTMMDDCHSPEEQKAFEIGLHDFDAFARKTANASFTSLTPQQRTTVLEQLESKERVSQELQDFYKKTKNLFIHGYLTSKHYLTQVQVYELVPGRYRGCVPVGENKKPLKAA